MDISRGSILRSTWLSGHGPSPCWLVRHAVLICGSSAQCGLYVSSACSYMYVGTQNVHLHLDLRARGCVGTVAVEGVTCNMKASLPNLATRTALTPYCSRYRYFVPLTPQLDGSCMTRGHHQYLLTLLTP